MKNKKIFLVIIALLTLVTLGTAIGEIYSEEEYKNIDMEKFSFNLKPTQNQIIEETKSKQKYYWIGYNYETIIPIGTAEYEKVPKQSQVIIPITEYNKCRIDGNTSQECIAEMKNEAIDRIINIREAERNQLKEKQQTDYSHELNENSITITAQEMNTTKIG